MRALHVVVLSMVVLPVARAQVLATQPFAVALRQAMALEAGATATDVPQHVHYELKLYDVHRHLTRGTWDIWRDPQHYIRTDMVAGEFRYTHIQDLARHVEWRHFNRRMPLKVYDLHQNYVEPAYAVTWFQLPLLEAQTHFEQVAGAPFECTETVADSRICFDPLAHVLAFAQSVQQTMTWENWQPVGLHSVPGRFRIYDNGQLIVEAAGQATVVKTFPQGLFTIPDGEPDMGNPQLDGMKPHPILHYRRFSQQPYYGNALVTAAVGPDGRVMKAKVIDSDDSYIEGDAKKFVRHLVLTPEKMGGINVGFQDFFYVMHWPLNPDDVQLVNKSQKR